MMSTYQKYKMVPLSVYEDLTNDVQTLANARAKIYKILDSNKLSPSDKTSLFEDLLSKMRSLSSTNDLPIVKTMDSVVIPETVTPPETKVVKTKRVKAKRPRDKDPAEESTPKAKILKSGRTPKPKEKIPKNFEKSEEDVPAPSETRPKRTKKPVSRYGWGARKNVIKVVYWRR